MALRTEILRAEVGSTLHGVGIAGYDDRDEMGVCIEDSHLVIGLRRFEQYIFRTQPPGKRSGHGDLDLVIYSLRKWMRLAVGGNPTVMLLLFVPQEKLVKQTDAGRRLQALAPSIASKKAAPAFLGYLRAQRQRLTGERGQKDVSRPELVEKYGFDTKFAMHALRLGLQGSEFLATGRLTLPMSEANREYLLQVRQGGVGFDAVVARLKELEDALQKLHRDSPLPDEPDHAAVDSFLLQEYLGAWSSRVGNTTS
jgi:hypothetical protein